jgi:hypothetical protein
MTYALRIHRHHQVQTDREELAWRAASAASCGAASARAPLDVEKCSTHATAPRSGMQATLPRHEDRAVPGLRVEHFHSPMPAAASSLSSGPMTKKTAPPSAADWNKLFPQIPAERIARLSQSQRLVLELSMLAWLAQWQLHELPPSAACPPKK